MSRRADEGTIDLLRRLLEVEQSDLLEAVDELDAVQRDDLQTRLKIMMHHQTTTTTTTTMRQPPTQATAASLANDEISIMYPLPNHPIPVEVLHQVCLSRYLTIQEEGRLLLLVSRSLSETLGTDLVWKLLCCRQWQNSSTIPPHVVDNNRRGYQWLFRQRARSILSEPDRNLVRSRRCVGPPLLLAKDLIMLISIFNSKRQEIVSISLTGVELDSFLQTGEMNISLLDPVQLGFHPINNKEEDGLIDFDMFCADFIHWRATIHLLRTDEYQCAVVHETRECSWGEYDYCEESCVSTNGRTAKMAVPLSSLDLTEEAMNRAKNIAKLPPVEVDMGYLEFSTGSQGFDLSVVGEAFLERIRQEETYVDDRLETIKMEPTLLCFTRDFDDTKRSVELAFSELRLDVWKTYRGGSAMLFNSRFESEKKNHGVTLLHLMENLNGWNE
jgi:hypothetical protein